MLISTVAALSTFYPDAKDIFNPDSRLKQTYRLVGKMPTLAAFAYRHSLGMPSAYPGQRSQLQRQFSEHAIPHHGIEVSAESYTRACPRHSFILHADHEQNCSSSAMRGVGSSHVRSLFGDGSSTRRIVRPAPWRRQRAGTADAARNRFSEECAGVYQKRKSRRKAIDGFRSSCVQELRSASQKS